MVNILISTAFRGVALIRGEVLIRGRHLFQCRYPKVWRLLEGGAYLRPIAYKGNMVLRKGVESFQI